MTTRKTQRTAEPGQLRGRSISIPLAVGLALAVVAIVLSLVGLWREDNLSLRNAMIAILLGGGTWGLVGWAITSAVVQVQEDLDAGAGDVEDSQP